MTFAFGSFTLGAALLFSAFKNMSLIDLVMGRPGQSVASQGESHPSATATAPVTGSPIGSQATTDIGGLATWTNPDGRKVKIAAWIWFELKRVGWHGYIESGYRSYSDQVAACASGAKPCATPGTSNHEGKVFPKGAIDVRASEAPKLSAQLKRAGSPLKWAGAKDNVHFSHPHDGSY